MNLEEASTFGVFWAAKQVGTSVQKGSSIEEKR